MRETHELADLLAKAMATYNRRDTLALDPASLRKRCRMLNEPGVLSLGAIATIVGISMFRVEQAISGMPRPKARGHLNPRHIPLLSYTLSLGKINKDWLEQMVAEGTSLSTIASLTNISESTLYRRRNE
jgi:AraC-like DNA-binding protein